MSGRMANPTQNTQQRLYEAEADVEVEHWEKRNSDVDVHEINQEYESQRFHSYNRRSQWADQAQREREMRN